MSIDFFSDISDCLIVFNTLTGTVNKSGDDLIDIESIEGSEHPMVLTTEGGVITHGVETIGTMPAVYTTQNSAAQIRNESLGLPTGAFSAFSYNYKDDYLGNSYFGIKNNGVAHGFSLERVNSRLYLRTANGVAAQLAPTYGNINHSIGWTVGAGVDTVIIYSDGVEIDTPENDPINIAPLGYDTLSWLNGSANDAVTAGLGGASCFLVVYSKELTPPEVADVHELMQYWVDHGQGPADPIYTIFDSIDPQISEIETLATYDMAPHVINGPVTLWEISHGGEGFSIDSAGLISATAEDAGVKPLVISATNAQGKGEVTIHWTVSDMVGKDPIFPYPDDEIKRFDDIPDLWGYWNGNESVIDKTGDIVTSITSAYGDPSDPQLFNTQIGINEITHGTGTEIGAITGFADSGAGVTSNLTVDFSFDKKDTGITVISFGARRTGTAGIETFSVRRDSTTDLVRILRANIDALRQTRVALDEINTDTLIELTDQPVSTVAAFRPGSDNVLDFYVDNLPYENNPIIGNPDAGNVNQVVYMNRAQNTPNTVAFNGVMGIMLIYARYLTPEEIHEIETLLRYWEENGTAP